MNQPETFYAYHVVTERPMAVGQVICFDETHHSGVWQRVMEKAALVQDIYAHPQQYDSNRLEHHTAVALRELALEEVRKTDYPQFPSRLGLFICIRHARRSAAMGKLFHPSAPPGIRHCQAENYRSSLCCGRK